MGKARADAGESSFDLAGQAEELTARMKGGLSRLAAGASRGAKRVKEAAGDLRSSAVLQHGLAARERGNLEAAFWLLNEEFGRQPVADVALHYWDIALSLGRVDIAAEAGVALIESHAAAGEPELAAQHWLELIKEAPDVLVSPAALATLLPALKQRHAEARDDGPDDRESLAGYLRRAVRHAVDPRNTGLHPGVALRLFEEGRELNPEAARRAAEAALESPHLHEAKRERLEAWLAGEPLQEKSPQASARPAGSPTASADAAALLPSAGLSRDEIRAAAARLPVPRARTESPPKTTSSAQAGALAPPSRAESAPASPPDTGPHIHPARLESLDGDGMLFASGPRKQLAWNEIEAVCVAEVMGLEAQAVALVDLVLNWSARKSERLEIIRLRVGELDLSRLVTRKHALGSDFAALMGDILERTSAIPLPDPESALGTRITCFQNPELYARVALRIPA